PAASRTARRRTGTGIASRSSYTRWKSAVKIILDLKVSGDPAIDPWSRHDVHGGVEVEASVVRVEREMTHGASGSARTRTGPQRHGGPGPRDRGSPPGRGRPALPILPDPPARRGSSSRLVVTVVALPEASGLARRS